MGLFSAIGSGLSKIGGLASKLAPVASLVPGVGTLAGAGLRAGGGILSGENIGSALKGAATQSIPGAGLAKIAGLAQGAQAGVQDGSGFLKFIGQVLGGKTTGENVRRLLTEVALPIAGGIEGRINRGQRNRDSDELDDFLRISGERGNERFDRFAAERRQVL